MRLAGTSKITPFLWYDTQAEEAARFYVSLFPKSRILAIARYGEGGMGPVGAVMTVDFEIAGQRVVALNGGPVYKLTEAFSFVVNCKDQAEVDRYWAKLGDGGSESQCGWLKDRFGLSWQVVPTALSKMITDADSARSARVMQALLKMVKLDLATLEAAYGPEPKRPAAKRTAAKRSAEKGPASKRAARRRSRR
jgi:predicted 3-demethylubiquinone-9 3-methyltransferase (glyoxalase superfamily)